MNITNETKLTQKATMFGDGAEGYYMQTYELYADDKETGVGVLVTGNQGKDNTTRVFTTKNGEFETPEDAFKDAGHDWAKT